MRIGVDASRAFVSEPTGTERYSFEVITRLVALPEAKSHTWILYVRPNYQLPITNYQSNSNVQIIQIPMRYLWTQAGLAYRTWIDNLDVLWIPAHTLPLLRRGSGGLGGRLKTVVTVHGIEYEWLPAYENVLQRWYLPLSTKYAVARADKIIAVSEFTKKQLVQRLGAPADKIEVVYEGASRNFQLPITNYQSILKKFNLQKKKYILFIGTVQPRKNLERLIEAYSGLGSGLKLVIAGKLGWGFERVEELAKKYGVVMTGYISDEKRYVLLHNAAVYVQPSITEGFGLPVLEAWEAGIPVATSGGGALAEITGNAGEVFDPLDVTDMRDKIKKAMADKGLPEKGKRRLAAFSWEKAAKKTYNILTDQ